MELEENDATVPKIKASASLDDAVGKLLQGKI